MDPTLISTLLDGGYIPVIATVGMDDLGPVSYTHLDVYKRQVLALGEPTTTALTEKPNLSPAVTPTTAVTKTRSRKK